jgi:tetratricopeptide (TPR) repeat protein/tRNA A-37 threonylcarbamoyl transferase component Bud32
VQGCPDEAQIVAYARGLLAPRKAQALEAHLDGCSACCEHVVLAGRESLAPSPERADDSPPEPLGKLADLTPGASLGRYTILELVGKGAMGAVYAAYDAELDRRVALKLLRAETERSARARELRDRLLREARTMAQLSHPNVIAVHDVGTFEGSVFLAMDFIHGTTLRQWLAARPRTWREILRIFLDAGRGLAAAHARGIIHRDFKADNVLVDAEERVFVADFGLARGARDLTADDTSSRESPMAAASVFQAAMTATGAALGTPAYMAPEQYEGSASPRSDLFAFGVALYEALYGVHPFPTSTLPGLRDAVMNKRLRAPPKSPPVPRFVRQALLRALEPDPDARWPTMDALVAALSIDPRRGLRVVVALLAAALLCAGAALGVLSQRDDPAILCPRGAQRLVGIWDGEKSQVVRAAFARTKLPYAAETAELAVRALDAYADAWTNAHREACEATHVRGEQSEELLDRRMQCLDDKLRDLGSLANAFATADPKTVENAAQAAARLPGVAACADRRRLEERIPPPEDPRTRGAVEEARSALARARALEVAGRYAEGLLLARGAVARARELGYRPLLAEALYRLGKLQRFRSENKTAVATLHEAEVAASAARHDEVELRARLAIIEPLSILGAKDEALRIAEHAVGRIEGGRGDSMLLADALIQRSRVQFEAGRMAEAEPPLRQALAILREASGTGEDIRLALPLHRLSVVLMNSGRYAEAVQLAERAALLSERANGSSHPTTAYSLSQLGAALMTTGQLARGEAVLRRALAIQQEALGPEHGATLATRGNLAIALLWRGHYAAALRELDLVIDAHRRHAPHSQHELVGRRFRAWGQAELGRLDDAGREAERLCSWAARDFGEANLFHATALGLAAYVLERQNRLAEALARNRRAVAILTRADDLQELLIVRLGEQRVLRKLGRVREALRSGEETLALLERRLGFGTDAAESALELGITRLGAGDPAGAREILGRVVALFDARREDVALVRVAKAKLALAESLGRLGRESTRARSLLREAQAHLAQAPHVDPRLQDEVRAVAGLLR